MALSIKGRKDNRVIKCIHHRVADIPGGATIESALLGGSGVYEGTPIGPGANGLYRVCKTAQVVEAVAAGGTTVKVAKGHHFKPGDYLATESENGIKIASIDKTDPTADVITLQSGVVGAVAINTCAFQSSAANKTLAVKPNAIAGTNQDVDGNVFEDAWCIAVVNAATCPIVNDTIKNALKGIHYV